MSSSFLRQMSDRTVLSEALPSVLQAALKDAGWEGCAVCDIVVARSPVIPPKGKDEGERTLVFTYGDTYSVLRSSHSEQGRTECSLEERRVDEGGRVPLPNRKSCLVLKITKNPDTLTLYLNRRQAAKLFPHSDKGWNPSSMEVNSCAK